MYSLLYVPIGNKSDAKKIAQILIQEKLAGCVNIIDHITSIYEWEGEIEESEEVVMLIKVNLNSLKCCKSRIEELHPYETPCIAEIKINSLNSCFSIWLDKRIDSDHRKNLSFSQKLEKQLTNIKGVKERLKFTSQFLCNLEANISKLDEFNITEAILCIDDLSKLWPEEMKNKAMAIKEKLIAEQAKLLKKDSLWTIFKKCLK